MSGSCPHAGCQPLSCARTEFACDHGLPRAGEGEHQASQPSPDSDSSWGLSPEERRLPNACVLGCDGPATVCFFNINFLIFILIMGLAWAQQPVCSCDGNKPRSAGLLVTVQVAVLNPAATLVLSALCVPA